MKKIFRYFLFVFLAAGLFLTLNNYASADTVNTDFESFSLGNINGQDGWMSGGIPPNHTVFDEGVVSNIYGYPSFGTQCLRLSNALTSVGFGDQTFSKSLANEAGETSAMASTFSGGVRQPYFEAQWDIASTVPGSEQPGLSVTASPDEGDGARMSWLQMQDTPTGLQFNFYDYESSVNDFVFTPVATGVDRTIPHTLKITMQFIDGPSNDIVKVYLDGALIHTGTSWEDYARSAGGAPNPVDSIMFRVGGTAAPANSGNGFLFDNFSSFSGPVPVPAPVPATLHIITKVINDADNDSDDTTPVSAFNVHVKLSGNDIGGSPAVGADTPGTSYTLNPGTYNIGEDVLGDFDLTFSGDCDISGNVTLGDGEDKTCTVNNSDVPANPATLHIITLVVNGSNGTTSPSDFNIHVKNSGADVSKIPQAKNIWDRIISIIKNISNSMQVMAAEQESPAPGAPAPGTAYSLAAGTYMISVDSDPSYTISFSGACDLSGDVSLSAGEDKTCTVIATNVPAPATSVKGSSGSLTPAIVSSIGVSVTPNPTSLPKGVDHIVYTYKVYNVGKKQSLSDIKIDDNNCSPVVFVSGDVNNDNKINPDEKWIYKCDAVVSKNTTDTVNVIGYSDDVYHVAAIDTAIVTVNINGPLPAPIINILEVPDHLTPLPFGGGEVTFTYIVTNPGTVAMQNIAVTDKTCNNISGPIGDANNNNLLDPKETWIYTCKTKVAVSGRSAAMVKGTANGSTVTDSSFANILVSLPNLPGTGLDGENNFWNIIIPVAVFIIAIALIIKEKKISRLSGKH